MSKAKVKALTAGINTAGRDTSFHTREFTTEETNFFLYRTVFLYVCFGIPGIERMLGIDDIHQLLVKTGYGINDEQVKKMIWVVCNFNHYLTEINANDKSTNADFIQLLISQYELRERIDTRTSQDIATSIATLVVRVFVAFQMRINLGNVDPESGGAQVASKVDVNLINIRDELTRDLAIAAADEAKDKTILVKLNTLNDKIYTAVGKKIDEINEGTDKRQSSRIFLLNRAIGQAAEKRRNELEEAKKTAQLEKEAKIRVETDRLQDCIRNFGLSIKFIKAIPAGIHKEFPVFKFEPAKFYKLLPQVLARLISSINSRIVSTEIKPGPGTAETLKSLGLQDPSIKDEDDDEQGGGSSIGAKRFGITKRKKNNKILRRLNSKNKKNPRKILYGGRGGVRHFGEHAQPIPQCDHTIGNYHEYVNPTCYICGEPWIEGVQSSMECEHILCVIHGIEYYGLLQSVYLSADHKNFLSILYAWAHRCCNQRKRNIAFIRKNPNQEPAARGNYFVPDDVNIRELLSDIFTLSNYPDNSPNSSFDCSKILKKKGKDNKKQFVDKRTAVVTSYVTPLVACVNTVFTGLFEANMVLFNAIGCLKIIAEMSIYLTAGRTKDLNLQLELNKTELFMNDVVFPNCRQQLGAGAGGGRRIIHDKKTRKSLRRKIQSGGAPNDIIDAISGLLAQEEYDQQIRDFKNDVDVVVNHITNPSSSRVLSNMLNVQFPGPPSPSVLLSSSPPQLGTGLTRTDSDKIDAILFILFVLNHSRNPTVLFDLFLDLKEPDRIVREQTELYDAQDERGVAQPVDVRGNITKSLAAYQAKRQVNKTAFITICTRVFGKPYTMNSITSFLYACDMMPSFIGVVMFCERQREFIHKKDHLIHIIQTYLSDIRSPRFHDNVFSTLQLFKTNIDTFLQTLTFNGNLFASTVAPETPLDHLVNACFHLKQMVVSSVVVSSVVDSSVVDPSVVDPSVVDPSVVVPSVVDKMSHELLRACFLFPSCFDEDIFSQFGPCAAYSGGVLEVHHFQDALGCVASAKTMCARILIEELTVTPSKHSSDEQRVALELFYGFFDAKDQEILSGRYTQPPLPRPAILSSSSVGSGLATHQTSNIVETINDAIQNFGKNKKNDEKKFVYIIIGMNWENGGLVQGEIPTTDASNKYIRDQLLANQTQSAHMLARYLREKGNTKTHEELVEMISVLFQIIESKLPQQKAKRYIDGDPATVQKKPSENPSGSRYLSSGEQSSGLIFPSYDEHDSQYVVVDRINNFVRLLLDQRPNPDSQEEILLFRQIEGRIKVLMDRFNRFTSANPLTQDNLIDYLTQVIALLLPQPSAPPSPSSETSQGNSPPRHERQPVDIASEILNTYHYFQDESFEDDDINVVYNYIMNPGWNNLKYNINISRPQEARKLEGGSSPHNTKRQHRKKQKIKSRRKNKYNTTKTRKNRSS
jgi:hypothetical protein